MLCTANQVLQKSTSPSLSLNKPDRPRLMKSWKRPWAISACFCSHQQQSPTIWQINSQKNQELDMNETASLNMISWLLVMFKD